MAEPNANTPSLKHTSRKHTSRKHTGRKHKGRSQPISRHPLFPAIVALWFAALLGLGSFAMPTTLLEALVLKIRLGQLIPAAAPPLGLTARLLLALALGALGAVVGWMLARRMALSSGKPKPQVLKMAEVDVDDPMPWPGMAEEPAPVAKDDETELPAEPASEPVVEESATVGPRQPIEVARETPLVPTAAQRIADAELADLSHVELVERLAIAIRRRQERLGATIMEAPDQARPVVRFPGLADRQSARQIPLPSAMRPVPQETEKALRDALANLQRMSGSG